MTYFLLEMDLLKLETERRFGGLEIRFDVWGNIRHSFHTFTHIHALRHKFIQGAYEGYKAWLCS